MRRAKDIGRFWITGAGKPAHADASAELDQRRRFVGAHDAGYSWNSEHENSARKSSHALNDRARSGRTVMSVTLIGDNFGPKAGLEGAPLLRFSAKEARAELAADQRRDDPPISCPCSDPRHHEPRPIRTIVSTGSNLSSHTYMMRSSTLAAPCGVSTTGVKFIRSCKMYSPRLAAGIASTSAREEQSPRPIPQTNTAA